MAPDKKPREAVPVYRCGDSHWHFIPHKDDHCDEINHPEFNPGHLPWYRCNEPLEEDVTPPVYAKGGGDRPYHVDDRLVSGFCTLWRPHEEIEWCMGRYGQIDRKLWRQEELSPTPWGGKKKGGPPPAYDSLSPSSSSRARDDKTIPRKN